MPEIDGQASRGRCRDGFRDGFSLVELLVVIAIIGALVGLLLPAVQSTRESSRRTKCAANLRQIGLAMHLYDSVTRRLPNSYGRQGESCFVPLLPFLEEGPLHDRFDASRSLADAMNAPFRESSVAVFVCPSMILPSPRPAPGWSSYALCSGAAYGHFVNAWHPEYHNGAIVEPGKGRVRLDAIAAADGSSKTFLGGDFDYGLGPIPGFGTGGLTRWAEGYPFQSSASTGGVFNATRLITGFRELDTFRSDHPGGVNMLFCDGAVRFIPETTNADVLRWLAGRDDGRSVEVAW
jgi:prepilin-type N-terminal cleavage/methylation domain-containing protein/prepilin-type processing-associated H-X9-DG protein